MVWSRSGNGRIAKALRGSIVRNEAGSEIACVLLPRGRLVQGASDARVPGVGTAKSSDREGSAACSGARFTGVEYAAHIRLTFRIVRMVVAISPIEPMKIGPRVTPRPQGRHIPARLRSDVPYQSHRSAPVR